MKKFPRFSPIFVPVMGLIGLGLRFWLYSMMGPDRLLPADHPAGLFTILLTLVTSCVLVLQLSSPLSPLPYPQRFSCHLAGALGFGAGALGVAAEGVISLIQKPGALAAAGLAISLAAAASMALLSTCRMKGKRPGILPAAVIILYFVLRAFVESRLWGICPQVQQYLYPLLATLFLLLTAYYQAEMIFTDRHANLLLLCNELALFFCLVSLNTSPILLPMAVWTLTESFHFREV